MLAPLLSAAEAGLLPDAALRLGIRRLLARRLEREDRGSVEANRRAQRTLLEAMAESPVAVNPRVANEQHYEVPAAFFEKVLGPHLKYSGCLWEDGLEDLGAAEAAMLDLTCRRAGLDPAVSERILELGCGWGSLTLWMAERYPGSEICAVSNSGSQRAFIEGLARERGLSNVRVATCDMNDFAPGEHFGDGAFDRVVSVEMFEHMRNWGELLRRISTWLTPEGTLFLHVFSHRDFAYRFETDGPGNWMGRHFFTAGLMPSDDLLLYLQRDLTVERHWCVSGRHYQATSEAWLRRQDAAKAEILDLFAEVYGPGEAKRWFHRWRIFFLSCAELFGARGGGEWLVSHYRLRRRGRKEP